ncbi:hypothetical protein HMPREF9148_02194, partial [Prevotella sp. F0091]
VKNDSNIKQNFMLLYVIISFLFGTIIPKIRRVFYNLLLVYLFPQLLLIG